MHFGGLPLKVIDDLILVLMHGVAGTLFQLLYCDDVPERSMKDTITSHTSTFPYDTAASEKILDLLNKSRDKISQGEIVTLVARFWGVIGEFVL